MPPTPVQNVVKTMNEIVQEIGQYPDTDVQDHPILIHIANALRASADILQQSLPSDTSIPAKDVDTGVQEQAQKGVHELPEVKGDDEMDGLSKASKLVALAKKYPDVAEVLNMSKDHPMLAKLITTPKQKTEGKTSKTPKPKTKKEGESASAGVVQVEDSLGSVHEIPVAALEIAKQRDPGLKVVEGGK